MSVAGAMVLIPDTADIKATVRAIARHGVPYCRSPAHLQRILNYPEARCGRPPQRAAVFFADPLHFPKTSCSASSNHGCAHRRGFGLGGMPVTHMNPVNGLRKSGSSAFQFPIDAKIVSMDDGVTETGPGEIGELAIRGPQIHGGATEMPEKTAHGAA